VLLMVNVAKRMPEPGCCDQSAGSAHVICGGALGAGVVAWSWSWSWSCESACCRGSLGAIYEWIVSSWQPREAVMMARMIRQMGGLVFIGGNSIAVFWCTCAQNVFQSEANPAAKLLIRGIEHVI
jgi:hypothetical protein